jgi:glycosyltransferase involved in cell wall biosynthesis
LTAPGVRRYKRGVQPPFTQSLENEPAPLDILYVITDLELGGVPLHLQRLAGAMKARGFRTAVVSLARTGPVGERLLDQGVPVHACGGRGGWDFRVLGRLARILRSTRPKLIHALLFHANLAAKWAAGAAAIPPSRVLCEIQTVEVERRWHLWVDRVTYDLCRLTIGNSPSVIDHLATQARIPRDRLRLVRGGVDPQMFGHTAPTDRQALGVPPEASMILWAGRLDPVKGLRYLIDSFRTVASAVNAHLLLAGGGKLRDGLQRHADREGLGKRVHLLGPRSDVVNLLQAADLFVFPSRTEGLPNALLEAMAAARPIVATNVPGCRDLIAHEQSGLLVPYGDTSALAAAMIRLLRDPPLAGRLGRGAFESVLRHWHIHRTWASYESLYAEALTDRQ